MKEVPVSFNKVLFQFLILTPMLSRLLNCLLCLYTILFLFIIFSCNLILSLYSSNYFSFNIALRRLSHALLSIYKILSVTTESTVDFLRLFKRFHQFLLKFYCFIAFSGFFAQLVHFFLKANSSNKLGSFSESCFTN